MELMFYCKKCKNYTELDADIDTREELAKTLGSPSFTVNCSNCEEESETHVNFIYAQKDFMEKYGSNIVFAILFLICSYLFPVPIKYIFLILPGIGLLIYQNKIKNKLKTFNSNKIKN
jgi:hypothetical protein